MRFLPPLITPVLLTSAFSEFPVIHVEILGKKPWFKSQLLLTEADISEGILKRLVITLS